MAQSRGEFKGLKELDEVEVRAWCAEQVRAAREWLVAATSADDPAELLAWHAAQLDRLVRALYARAGLGEERLISLVALGGYGRGELYPYSDLDLLVLCEEEEEGEAIKVVEAVVYPLWDAGVKVGHAVRTQAETLDLASEDLTVCSSLLDARHLAGNLGLTHALQAAGLRRLFGPSSGRFMALLQQERAGRHRRFGDTVYLLEPNIKSGRGGLRDLATGLWAAKARLGLDELDQLDAQGGASPRQERALLDAQGFLRGLRLAMHVESGRQQDQLSFELQERLAPELFPEQTVPGVRSPSPAVAPAVERLMEAYYRHAHAVVMETEGILERLSLLDSAAPPGSPVTQEEGEHLELAGSLLRSAAPERFWQEPAELVRALAVSLELGARLERSTRDLIAEAAAGQPGLMLAVDPRAAQLFLELLIHPEEQGESTLLEEVHDLGVLRALLPEFGPCTGRVQHDLYHVYTVDRHSIYVVGLLKAWMRGEQAGQHPTAVDLIGRLDRPEGLLLAALLHDVGKPLGSGHAARGATMARGAAARLGLDAELIEDVTFLVREHLTMAHTSQRRDLEDPDVIGALAQRVGHVDRLRALYLLTLADTAMTAPGNLTDWKARLLEDLYIRTYGFLVHGKSLSLKERERRAAQRREKLEGVLRGRFGEAGVTMAQRLPSSMLLAHEEEDLLHHVEAALDLESGDGLVSTRAQPQAGGTWQLTVCCADRPGLLAAITGVMLAHKVEVLAAQCHTLYPRPEGGEGTRVLDIFTVRVPVCDEDDLRWQRLERDLEGVLEGTLELEALVRRRTSPTSPLLRRVLPRIPTEVSLDNDASDRFTVVEVQAQDGVGVLHAITRALSDLGLAIQVSRVNTEAARAVDIFYVCEADSGAKLESASRQAQVRQGVNHALARLGR